MKIIWNKKKQQQQEEYSCKEIEKMVIPYIQKELSNKELRTFVSHVKQCPECMEELETYYIVYKGLMQLDEKENLPMNIMESLESDLDFSAGHLRNLSVFYVVSEIVKILSSTAVAALGIFLLIKLVLSIGG